MAYARQDCERLSVIGFPRIQTWSRSMRPRSSTKFNHFDIAISVNRPEAGSWRRWGALPSIYRLPGSAASALNAAHIWSLTTSKLEKAISGREGVSRGFHRGFEWCSACRANQESAELPVERFARKPEEG